MICAPISKQPSTRHFRECTRSAARASACTASLTGSAIFGAIVGGQGDRDAIHHLAPTAPSSRADRLMVPPCCEAAKISSTVMPSRATSVTRCRASWSMNLDRLAMLRRRTLRNSVPLDPDQTSYCQPRCRQSASVHLSTAPTSGSASICSALTSTTVKLPHPERLSGNPSHRRTEIGEQQPIPFQQAFVHQVSFSGR